MSVIIGSGLSSGGVDVSPKGIVIGHSAVRRAAMIRLHICSIAAVVTMHEHVGGGLPCDNKAKRKNAKND
jgi:hypothetical protein